MPFFSDQEPVSETLFSDRSLSTRIDMQNGRAENVVAKYSSDALLSTPTEDIVERAYDVCHLEVPVLREDKTFQADPREVTREVRDYGRVISVEITVTVHLTASADALASNLSAL
ncbi:hypothetical protein G8O24_42045 [Bradyrhizobium sp. INPA01-394B]|uniref:Uncharacterized protein n=1 Tax=Bradyrhizobium campsiandrae TaxID=1729892 RepID=A0ABR7TZQ3_9BRAD|nr:hypothetical protein [Bradyrhizobium campsiandrae]MBC9883858.1 hypothetical protein [Bradyrhizobium campsiandrae]MBC9976800.1 hypothetical protein [Bradyrhizobium campsiandrae]